MTSRPRVAQVTVPDSGMSPEQIRVAVEAAVTSSFDHAAVAFSENPSTHNWRHLEDAMWARQAVTSEQTMASALPKLVSAGVGHWLTILRAAHNERLA